MLRLHPFHFHLFSVRSKWLCTSHVVLLTRWPSFTNLSPPPFRLNTHHPAPHTPPFSQFIMLAPVLQLLLAALLKLEMPPQPHRRLVAKQQPNPIRNGSEDLVMVPVSRRGRFKWLAAVTRHHHHHPGAGSSSANSCETYTLTCSASWRPFLSLPKTFFNTRSFHCHVVQHSFASLEAQRVCWRCLQLALHLQRWR